MFLNWRFSYAGNWELVKSIVGTKFRRIHLCLHTQAGNRLAIKGPVAIGC